MIKQRPERYKPDGADAVLISASPAVTPVRIKWNDSVDDLLPLLQADGVIVQLGSKRLCSPETLTDLRGARSSGDPHYWPSATTSPGLPIPTGATVPTIVLDISGLQAAAEAQGFVLRTAGVTEIDWPYDDTGEVPEGILRQVNWTLSPNAERPADRWRLSGLGLGADYSYATLKIAPPAEGGRIDYNGISEIVKRVSERLADLRVDFNRIGDMYFDGVLPDGAGESDLIVSAITEVPPQQAPDPNRQRIRKETRLVSVDSGPADRGNAGADVVSAIGAAAGDNNAAGATTPPADNGQAAGDPNGRRTIVDRAVGLANTYVTRVLGATTPVGLIVRGLRRLFGR